SIPNSGTAYNRVLETYPADLKEEKPSYLYHEFMEEFNRPCYFHEFAARVAAHGLQYIDESTPSPSISMLPAKVTETMQQIADNVIELEQYLDYFLCRTFRQSLLTHENVSIKRGFDAARLRRFRYTTLAKPPDDPPPLDDTTFVNYEVL